MFEQVVSYYHRMVAENGDEAAMAYTLEMFEGLTEAQVEYALAESAAL